ncbi:hypothetical protein KAR91_61050 [Candidatus Pacearchaeota archaeon]|nr:hypothetical protein [Candidatus Pacearchaeota archaeon]
MTSRQKRFRKQQAEEVKLALTGHVRCPRCEKFAKDELRVSFWVPTAPAMCLACRNDSEIEFIESVTKDMGKEVRFATKARTKMIYGKSRKL